MNSVMNKSTIVIVLLLINASVLAHDQSGSLATAQSSTDYYQVSCYDDGNGSASYLEFSVMDAKPVAAPIISAQISKGYQIVNTSDNTDSDASYSPDVIALGGSGAYFVMINKNKAGVENYAFQYHCMTADNQHTGTDITPLQNQ